MMSYIEKASHVNSLVSGRFEWNLRELKFSSDGHWTLLSTNYAGKKHHLTHWGRDKMAAISQTMFSNALSWNKNTWILIKISLKFVPKGPINNNPALVQIMAWHLVGAKPLSEPMMVRSPMHICTTRPQWVKSLTFVDPVGDAIEYFLTLPVVGDPVWCIIWVSLIIQIIAEDKSLEKRKHHKCW